jgi:hypothetical protein
MDEVDVMDEVVLVVGWISCVVEWIVQLISFLLVRLIHVLC